VIGLRDLTKIYPGQPRPAVDRLTLDVEAGRTCVLVGPSGCGKTTTMKMVNRLIEPTSGTIEVDGRDASRMDPVRLRRSIGYVIQQIGLFPHMTIAANIATVPRLLGWPPTRIASRVDEMLTLVGLDPGSHRERYPRELSGGERQRVGVARALAGDPPVMLMDEPFGAVDPITRTHLQNEFLKILRTLRKTILFVTHDVDEAIKMGDTIAIMKDGRLVQAGTPDEILARPADAFVEEFFGSDRALKRLNLVTVREVMRSDLARLTVGEDARAPLGGDEKSPRFRIVTDRGGRVVGYVNVAEVNARGSSVREALRRLPQAIRDDATAKEALSTMLASDLGSLPVVDAGGRLVGLLSLPEIQRVVAP
jgi:osmoprotectant transport system ATP-binding protein